MFHDYTKFPILSQVTMGNRKHSYFRENFFKSVAIWLGSHPEASGHGSSKRRASRGISGFSSLVKIHGLTNQFA